MKLIDIHYHDCDIADGFPCNCSAQKDYEAEIAELDRQIDQLKRESRKLLPV